MLFFSILIYFYFPMSNLYIYIYTYSILLYAILYCNTFTITIKASE